VVAGLLWANDKRSCYYRDDTNSLKGASQELTPMMKIAHVA
jgi:hypothetical protein